MKYSNIFLPHIHFKKMDPVFSEVPLFHKEGGKYLLNSDLVIK